MEWRYILVNIEKGIEVGAEDVLSWLIGTEKILHAAPAVIAALATLVADGEAAFRTRWGCGQPAQYSTRH